MDSVIDRARVCFARYGYRKTTIDEIAADVHISKRTIYELLGTKEELMREVAWRDTVAVLEAFKQELKPGIEPNDVLIAFCRYIFRDRVRRGIDGLFIGSYSNEMIVRDAYRSGVKRVLREIINTGMTAGCFKKVDTSIATDTVTAMLFSLLYSFPRYEEPVTAFNQCLGMIMDAVTSHDRRRVDIER
jgi:AcrR family transcriptional regulator